MADETQKQQTSAEPDLLEKTSEPNISSADIEVPKSNASKKSSPWVAGISLIALSVSLGHLTYPFWHGAISPLLTEAGLSFPPSTDQASVNQADILALQSQLTELTQDLAEYQKSAPSKPDLTALLTPVIEKQRGQIEQQLQQKIDQLQAQLRQSQTSAQNRQTDVSQELDLMADRLLRMTQEMETSQKNLKNQQQTILTQAEQGQQGLRAQKTLVAELQLQQNRFGQELGRFQQQLANIDGQKWVHQAMRLTLAAKLAQGGNYQGFDTFIKSEKSGLASEDRAFLLKQIEARGVTALNIQLAYLTIRPKLYQMVTQMPETVAAQSRDDMARDDMAEGQNWVSQTWQRAKSLIRIEKLNPDPAGQETRDGNAEGASQMIRQDIDLLYALDQAVQHLDFIQMDALSQQMMQRHTIMTDSLQSWLADMHILRQMSQISEKLVQVDMTSDSIMQQHKGQSLPEGSGQ